MPEKTIQAATYATTDEVLAARLRLESEGIACALGGTGHVPQPLVGGAAPRAGRDDHGSIDQAVVLAPRAERRCDRRLRKADEVDVGLEQEPPPGEVLLQSGSVDARLPRRQVEQEGDDRGLADGANDYLPRP